MLGLFEAFSIKCLQLQQAVCAGHDELVRALDSELDPLIGIILSYKAENSYEMHMQMQFLAALIREDAEDSSSVIRHSAAMSMLIDRYFADSGANKVSVHAPAIDAKTKKKSYPDALFSEVVLEALPDRIAVITKDYCYLYANSLHSKYLNRTQLSLIGCSVSEFMGREYFEIKVKPNLDRCFAGESLDYAHEQLEQGSAVTLRYRMTPLRSTDNSIVGALVIIQQPANFPC